MKTSVRLLSLAVTVAIPLVSTTAPAQKAAPPSKVELEAITARGRLLAEYSLAATGAADAVKAMRPALGCPEVRPGDDARLIARKSDKVWVVVFGRMNEQRDKFLIACEATQAKPQ
ncbi:MAG TPA: hypothetical protein VGQ11_01865, partial [Candidatus Acidoferrales bacterium]|nr:hypothetical protein [Candidatus Acidoferrales bacterium]